MAGQKSRSSRVSNGGRTKANKAHEAKRQAKFAAKREVGKAYEYKKNPYKENTNDWLVEQANRAEKAKSSKLPYSRLTSIFAKLDNEITKQKDAAAKAKASRKEKKATA